MCPDEKPKFLIGCLTAKRYWDHTRQQFRQIFFEHTGTDCFRFRLIFGPRAGKVVRLVDAIIKKPRLRGAF